jgi:hypothetical protein
MPASAYTSWRNQQFRRSDVVPGWLPVLIPYTCHLLALAGQLNTLAHSPVTCSEGYAAPCVCEGEVLAGPCNCPCAAC